ncbi:MAG: hypothetical protein GY869_10895 [Planctomycetes bacterium]|nr:hypothetical protein [Planctomycetota bacterium]
MNSYERYMGMIRGEKVDIVPRIPILMHFAVRHINADFAAFACDHKVLVQANRQLVGDFGIDQLDIMSDPWREMADFGGQIEYQPNTIPRCVKIPLEDAADLNLLQKPDPVTSKRMSNAINAIKGFKEFGCQKYSITGWVEGPAAEAADLRGVTNFMMDLIDKEDFSRDLMNVCVDNAIEFARAQIEHGADTIGVGDAIVSQMSPKMYEKLVLDLEKRLFDAIHQMGGLVRLHICGDINRHLPLIAALNIDIIDCDWMVDIEQARKILGDKIVLTGNLDPVHAVMNSTPEKIRRGFREIYQKVGNPYFVNAGCEIPGETSAENLHALCEPIPCQ